MRKITGTISGDYLVGVNIEVYDSITKTLAGSLQNAGSPFEVDVDTENPCTVILTPDIGIMWKPNQFWVLGAKCFPSSTVPFYYECVGSGQGGQIEPLFTGNTFSRVFDNDAIWRLVQRIPVPKIRYPVAPH